MSSAAGIGTGQSLRAVPRVLILGGTTEGAEIAGCLATRSDVAAISSLAGRVGQPKLPKGMVRVGGFGGVDGLISYLESEKIIAVVDATHPFAVRISHNAEVACRRLGLPLIALERPVWKKTEEDIWHEVDGFHDAAEFVDKPGARVFLSIGRQELHAFEDCKEAWYLIRVIDQPQERLPLHHEILLQRGPFDVKDEVKLLGDYSIDFIVSKNSGGAGTYTKIEAARFLRIPVVMIGRPRKHTVPVVQTVEQALMELDLIVRRD